MPSFDVVSEVDMQEVDNALHTTQKEISTRYDFKGSKASIDRKDKEIILLAEDEYKLGQMIDLFSTRLVKRGVDLKALDVGKTAAAAGGMERQVLTLKVGLETEVSKRMIKHLKDGKFKAQGGIQGDQLRVSGKSRDELQAAIAALRSEDFGLPLQFNNFRD
ncbi:YajQ family cyclic di-GMP-binding protein [Acidithiobacillus thiooxidans]|uniref:YajQ family cyclic di-GMP-binding protein n=1 Tax=Acidithiobacillus TaxID=119977 RepID=UPI0004E2851E|nr:MULTISPECIES: YajQ family cyclic di-GMP-binding protein [Acidithiobacillus]MBU2741143.1 YajQ family cyclic di-GMP-binding protein [Acidithiobacillus albertensis]MBU2794256.1 YajQ family cyclic di-GMP-binding protein [Acidithiobacillus thiooxidans]MBU2835815.1 YajQ family cyclic di-GMP-binding protein [Acidithiobacillus thiooxidans]MDA8175916.1 YajQ family cyclic di-GMP-binding protein [Acidithiobacillus sp.]